MLRWIPRILSILAILILVLFSLDVFEQGVPVAKALGGFLIHNIPSFILIALLAFTWKHEHAGGMVFIAVGAALSVFIFLLNYYRSNNLTQGLLGVALVGVPFIISGVLFMMNAKYHDREDNVN